MLHELYEEMALLVKHGFNLVGSCKEGNPITQNVALALKRVSGDIDTSIFSCQTRQPERAGAKYGRGSSSSSASMVVGAHLCHYYPGRSFSS